MSNSKIEKGGNTRGFMLNFKRPSPLNVEKDCNDVDGSRKILTLSDHN